MTIVADFHNTISDFPTFFKMVDDLYIVTGSSLSQRAAVNEYLVDHQIKAKVINCPTEWRTQSEYLKSKIWKAHKVASLKPDIYFDDSMRSILMVQKLSPKTIGMLVIKNEISVIKKKKPPIIGYRLTTNTVK